jgi:hypothetical protein
LRAGAGDGGVERGKGHERLSDLQIRIQRKERKDAEGASPDCVLPQGWNGYFQRTFSETPYVAGWPVAWVMTSL